MSYFDSYERQAIQPGYVDKDGDYIVTIQNIKDGNLSTGERYTQIKCVINYPSQPRISIFLTEGKNFNGNFTAFLDTFGIDDYRNPQSWIGRSGYIHIILNQPKQKDGFVNMVPRWILGADGFVLPEVKIAARGGRQQMQQPQQQVQPQQMNELPPQVQNVQDAFGGGLVLGPDGDTYGDIQF